ncbi:hypothetical protein PPERSA_12918 [Pseudocohnilembus persalinus]|uniref:Uncharacterized protein n=1 Tax=Pseudocohnilembus persalinus TaxID=266149 RepID=A0A0V0R2M3_PSEPJ|nr:hypothetical protein PPERSA_12918 [Pseudocohnilembus persalinus]|eukprot:KRX08437.1 hypothetical protein PPERSA_12918 [Pseudocohnilembus persalinus]
MIWSNFDKDINNLLMEIEKKYNHAKIQTSAQKDPKNIAKYFNKMKHIQKKYQTISQLDKDIHSKEIIQKNSNKLEQKNNKLQDILDDSYNLKKQQINFKKEQSKNSQKNNSNEIDSFQKLELTNQSISTNKKNNQPENTTKNNIANQNNQEKIQIQNSLWQTVEEISQHDSYNNSIILKNQEENCISLDSNEQKQIVTQNSNNQTNQKKNYYQKLSSLDNISVQKINDSQINNINQDNDKIQKMKENKQQDVENFLEWIRNQRYQKNSYTDYIIKNLEKLIKKLKIDHKKNSPLFFLFQKYFDVIRIGYPKFSKEMKQIVDFYEVLPKKFTDFVHFLIEEQKQDEFNYDNINFQTKKGESKNKFVKPN